MQLDNFRNTQVFLAVCYILLLLFFLENQAFSQIQIRSQLLDSTTKQPIAFADIQIANSLKGTISNAEGYFSLITDNLNDSLIVSYLGYKYKKLSVSEIFFDSTSYILLSPKDFTISQIDVMGYRAEKLIEKAMQKIPENYLNVAAAYKAYFREMIFNGNVMEKFSDANILIAKQAYDKNKPDKMEFISGRNYENNEKSPLWNYIYFVNGTYEALHCDAMKYRKSFILIPDNRINFLNSRKFKFYTYNIGYESNDQYVINFEPARKKAVYEGQIVINKIDTAIVAVFYQVSPSRLNRVSFLNSDTEKYLHSENIYTKSVDYFAYVFYHKTGKKYTFKQSAIKYQTLFYSPMQNIYSNLSVIDQMVITEIDTSVLPKISVFEQIGHETSVHQQIINTKNKKVHQVQAIEPEKFIRNFMYGKK